jgi:hypothetical protein
MHQCVAIGGISIPLIEVPNAEAAPDGRHVVVKREDYGTDAERVSSIRTERGDGSNDTTILAPVAFSQSQAY